MICPRGESMILYPNMWHPNIPLLATYLVGAKQRRKRKFHVFFPTIFCGCLARPRKLQSLNKYVCVHLIMFTSILLFRIRFRCSGFWLVASVHSWWSQLEPDIRYMQTRGHWKAFANKGKFYMQKNIFEQGCHFPTNLCPLVMKESLWKCDGFKSRFQALWCTYQCTQCHFEDKMI